jgi:hypothetical protein
MSNMQKRTLIIIVVLLMLLCCCLAIAAGIGFAARTSNIFANNPDTTVGVEADRFLNDLRQNNFNRAFNRCLPSLQEELHHPEGLIMRMQQAGGLPRNWHFTSINVKNDRAELNGEINYDDGRSGRVHLIMQRTGRGWRVAVFDLTVD